MGPAGWWVRVHEFHGPLVVSAEGVALCVNGFAEMGMQTHPVLLAGQLRTADQHAQARQILSWALSQAKRLLFWAAGMFRVRVWLRWW